MTTSAEIVVEFVRGRPDLELEIRRITGDGFKAPEARVQLVMEEVIATFSSVTAEEIAALNRMRGNGAVVWADVVKAFGGC